MLTAAGIGVAMGNAEEEVKSAADHITLSNEEDGVYHFLLRYFHEALSPN
jgi:hydroxymethylpyrimidine pyrophosphatase-like HAD family hydrolase